MPVSTLMSADDLLRLPDDGWRHELVRGELRTMSPAGEEHGFIGMKIGSSLYQHVDKHGLGRVYNADTGFRVARNPDTVLAPDAAFVRADRVAPTRKYFEGAPDAAFEVVSQNDTYAEVQEKTAEWLGVELAGRRCDRPEVENGPRPSSRRIGRRHRHARD